MTVKRAVGLAGGLLLAGALGWWALILTPMPSLARAEMVSPTVVDRSDQLLRAYTARDGRWRFAMTARAADPHYIRMLLAYEDRRFFRHWGVDPLSLIRATAQAVWYRRPVSGGSTLTMQVARLLDGRHEQTTRGKLRQIVRALRLERSLSKDEILGLYLTLAPFGGNVEGVRAASLSYFGKEPSRLSIAEAALLVAIPQSPEQRRLDRHRARAHKARDQVINRVLSRRAITIDDARLAYLESVPMARAHMPQLAAHLSDTVREAQPDALVVQTTLDAQVQARLESLTREHAVNLGPHVSAALMVIDHRTGHVLARVGSADFRDGGRLGAVDMSRAVRSPGSTLKPFIYGLAFDQGLVHPETLIEDRPSRFGTYAPKNFDRDWHGTVTIREALAQSLNIPAVKVLDALGPVRLMSALESLGIEPELPKGAVPTLAIALGGVGLRLDDLATAYTALARGGEAIPVTHLRHPAPPVDARPRTSFLSTSAAWQITEILRNAPPPVAAKAGQIAFKTGTSYGYRDAWSVGYDGRHVIAVWVGRADGQTIPGLNGRGSAAPLLFDAFRRISAERVALRPRPSDVLIAKGDALPPPLRRFDAAADPESVAPAGFRDPPLAFQFPLDRADIEIDDPVAPRLTARVEGGALPLTWLVDGAPAPVDGRGRQAVLEVPKAGFVRITVIDAHGRSDHVRVRVR